MVGVWCETMRCTSAIFPNFGRFCLVLALLPTLLISSGEGLAADPPGAADHDRAQQIYQEALSLYKGGHYREAIDKLVAARRLDPTAKELPYNLGLLHEKIGEIDLAIKDFELYLNLETEEEEKERVRAILRRLEGARAELKRNRPQASASISAAPVPVAPSASVSEGPPAPPALPSKGRLDGVVYGTGGLAIAAIGSGVFFGVRALALRPEASTANQPISILESKQQQAHKNGVIADISFGVAAVSGVTALLLYFLRDAPPAVEASSSALVAPTPGGGWVGWRGQF